MMKPKEKITLLLLTVLILGAIVYTADCLLLHSALTWQLQQKPYLFMAGELLVLFSLFVVLLRFFRSAKIRRIAVLFFLGLFLWMHQILIPIITSGLYMVWLWLFGRWFRRRIFTRKHPYAFSSEPLGKAFSRELLMGCLLTVCCFCLMSALNIGKTENLWIFILDATAIMALDLHFWKEQWSKPPKTINAKKTRQYAQIIIAALLTLFCIQAGRMNIAVDFDSIWYGVRSPYILNNGGGIYENLGTIGVVYTYSKGLEILTLPLSILPSYSFVIAFNLWLAAAVLVQTWQIGRVYLRKRSAWTLILFLASLPGMMNMCITAKSDMATLYIQLLMFYELLNFLTGESVAFWYALGAFLFSWTLKPTAMVFSTAIMGMSILYLLFSPKQPLAPANRENHLRKSRRGCPEPTGTRQSALTAFFLSLAALIGVWARTFLITGLPVTSVFSSVLTRIGFQMHYPFNAKTIPNNTSGITPQEQITAVISRIYGVLFNPQGKDLDHVIIAWGSLETWFLLCFCVIWLFLDKKGRTEKERMIDHFFTTVFLPLSACCFISLIMLYQVDGNYFMLFYVFSALCIFRLAERLSSQTAVKIIHTLTLPVILFSVIITTLTSWAWSLGFTPIAWKHKGYYPHQEKQHQEMIASGNGQIWEILSQNPRNRLISIGDHPQSLVFPCNAQSYLDITKNAWGNPELAETMDNFTEFMAYAKTDYVYIQADYISLESHEWQLICELIRNGILIPLCYEQGNVLAYVDIEGTPDENGEKLLEEFAENYQVWTG